MSLTVTGSAKRLPSKVIKAAKREFASANADNAKLIVDVAKALIPQRTGQSRLAIRNVKIDDGAQIVDFGPKSKVIEGDRGPRAFVNPALAGTKRKRKARNNKATKAAIRAATNGG